MDLSKVHKKIQYITIDSQFISSSNTSIGSNSLGGNNNFSINFGSNYLSGNVYVGSNVFIQEMKNVIGFKLVDFYVTQIASSGTSSTKYIDILCPNLPDSCQILDERKSKIFARIPLERSFGSSNVLVNDREWKTFPRDTSYFNPLSIKQLPFQIWEMNQTTTNGYPEYSYVPLQPDAGFYMVIEVTTIDNTIIELPQDDTTSTVIKTLETLTDKFDTLAQSIPMLIKDKEPIKIETPAPVIVKSNDKDLQNQKNMLYWVIGLLVILIIYVIFGRR
jgi:hypothetical protein